MATYPSIWRPKARIMSVIGMARNRSSRQSHSRQSSVSIGYASTTSIHRLRVVALRTSPAWALRSRLAPACGQARQ